MEHYRDEILEAIKYGATFGLMGGERKTCGSERCVNCEFYPADNLQSCTANTMLWMMADYKPEITLTAREKHFVEFVEKGWIARDEDGETVWYLQKPNKDKYGWKCNCDYVTLGKFWDGCFNFITWEDEEPWAVSELRKLKTLEYNPEDVALRK